MFFVVFSIPPARGAKIGFFSNRRDFFFEKAIAISRGMWYNILVMRICRETRRNRRVTKAVLCHRLGTNAFHD